MVINLINFLLIYFLGEILDILLWVYYGVLVEG